MGGYGCYVSLVHVSVREVNRRTRTLIIRYSLPICVCECVCVCVSNVVASVTTLTGNG